METVKIKRLVQGVGINDAGYSVVRKETVDGKLKIVWRCPYYSRWASMFCRCYSQEFLARNPSYLDCIVSKEWHLFSNFKAWMETQDWEGKDLDKDLLGTGKLYGPETCIFIDGKVNVFLVDKSSRRGAFPIGVSRIKSNGKFQSQCCCVVIGRDIYLGCYLTEQEAYQAWLKFKIEQANILAAEQKDDRVAEAIIAKYKNYTPIMTL